MRHFESTGGDATSVAGFARPVKRLHRLKHIDALSPARHVCAFDHRDAVGVDEGFGVRAGEPLVLAEQVADFARTDADIASRYIDLAPDVAISLVHKRLAETHDLVLGAALRPAVRVTLTRNDRKAGEHALEGLFVTRTLNFTRVDVAVKAQATLVGLQRAIQQTDCIGRRWFEMLQRLPIVCWFVVISESMPPTVFTDRPALYLLDPPAGTDHHAGTGGPYAGESPFEPRPVWPSGLCGVSAADYRCIVAWRAHRAPTAG